MGTGWQPAAIFAKRALRLINESPRIEGILGLLELGAGRPVVVVAVRLVMSGVLQLLIGFVQFASQRIGLAGFFRRILGDTPGKFAVRDDQLLSSEINQFVLTLGTILG